MLHVHVSDAGGQPAADAVVSLRALDFAPPAPNKSPQAVMDQRNRRFVPHVLPVQVGTEVAFPNSDNIKHHVYSFSEPKRFELPLYRESGAAPVTFDQPGLVVLGCNIHDWMLGYIYVAGSPYFGKTDAQGNVRIEALPAGRYEVRLWHPNAADEPRRMATLQVEDDAKLKRSYVVVASDPPETTEPAPSPSVVEDKFKRWRK